MKKQLTVKEALEQGYTHYGDGDFLSEIEDIEDEEDFPNGAKLYDPVLYPLVNISEDVIRQLLADNIYSQVGEKINQDHITEKIYDQVMKFDFSTTVEMINTFFKAQRYYELTDIELIP